MDYDLSAQQVEAKDEILKWWNDEYSDQVFYLAGYAGSGKTTLIKYLLPYMDLDISNEYDVTFGAYTNKASIVMRRTGILTANTIHSMIYHPEEQDDGTVLFKKNRDSIAKDTSLIVLDECSMIDDDMANDLDSYGTKILVLGDPGQLPPIKGEGHYTKRKPDYFLTEIHRQAEGNPIIQLSMLARQGQFLKLGEYGDGVRVVDSDDMEFEDFLKADQVLSGKNVTRQFLNKNMKEEYGFNDVLPMDKGIKLICLKNQKKIGLYNGMMFESMFDRSHVHLGRGNKFFTQSVMNDEGFVYDTLDISAGPFNDYKSQRDAATIQLDRKNNRNHSEFDYGYAITVHKSQGSQWENIIIYDDDFGMWDKLLRARWLYTGITRAQTGMIIIR